jgi:hypothetical protein
MDKKFYVTFKTAKLLKEKGFNKAVDKLIHLNKYNIPIIESPEKYYDDTEAYNDYMYLKQNHYACPTKSEVIEWLDRREIFIDVCKMNSGWSFVVRGSKYTSPIYDSNSKNEYFQTRLEAEDEAIFKAFETEF